MFFINLILRFYTSAVDLLSGIYIPRNMRVTFFRFFGRYFMKMNINDFLIIPEQLTYFENLKQFFVRNINMSKRPIAQHGIVSPCDAKILEFGDIKNGTLVQVKGINYSLYNLLLDKQLCESLQNGSFISLYLSPRNYHRFHCPCNGTVESIKHIPGYVLPVNKLGLKISSLYTRNERFIVTFRKEDGTLITLAIVGAAAVSKIRIFKEKNQKVVKGDELGYFELGSSIVVIINKKFRVMGNREDVVNALGALWEN